MSVTTFVLIAAILAQPMMLVGLVVHVAFKGLRLG